MKVHSSYNKLLPERKKDLIEQALASESISRLCAENGISRTIFYKWLKTYKATRQKDKEHALSSKIKTGQKHWRKIESKKEQEIIDLWLNNPEYSIRKIAREESVSIGGVWKILKEYETKAKASGKKSIRRYKRKKYKTLSQGQKVLVIKRRLEGVPISKVARETGISRTIIYRWIKDYNFSRDREEALSNKRPRGENHWRFIPGLRDSILEVVASNPRLSLSGISQVISEKGQKISRSGLYYILKGMQLESYNKRFAYAESVSGLSNQNTEVLRPKNIVRIGYPDFIIQFATLSLLSFFVSFVLLQTMIHHKSFRVPMPISISIISQAPKNSPSKTIEKTPPTQPPEKIAQDFRWGALSFNSPKSVYSGKDNIKLGFGTIDHAGNAICNAKIDLEIADPVGKKVKSLSTETGGIRQSGECSVRSVTNTADYIADLGRLPKDGIYKLNIKAQTYDGKKEFRQKLLVSENSPFEIERISYPTRVYPVSSYPLEVTIKANENFKGNLSESLPKGIIATNISQGGIFFKSHEGGGNSLRWQVDLKRNETYRISYTLTFPQIWPAYYEIGTIRLTDSKTDRIVFQEERYWQVVADAAKKD